MKVNTSEGVVPQSRHDENMRARQAEHNRYCAHTELPCDLYLFLPDLNIFLRIHTIHSAICHIASEVYMGDTDQMQAIMNVLI